MGSATASAAFLSTLFVTCWCRSAVIAIEAWPSCSKHLRDRQREPEVRERRVEVVTKLASQPVEARTKTGRNDRYPCGSGLKHKHSHGLPRR